jgi:hypothetical protein
MRTPTLRRTRMTKREAAVDDTRRRLAEIRAAVASRAEDLADQAEERWEDAREAAAPRVADLRRLVAGIGVDVRDVSRAEADRVIEAVRRSAAESRAEVVEADRRRGGRAAVGWTAVGLVAGYLLASRVGPRPAPPAATPRPDDGRADGPRQDAGSSGP